jgi:uncharacterized membrane protein YozB (DUF420 family)
MMTLFFAGSVLFYVFIASQVFTIWLEFFKKYTSPLDRRRSSYLFTLWIGTILWPIVVPIAYVNILKAKQIHDLC